MTLKELYIVSYIAICFKEKDESGYELFNNNQYQKKDAEREILTIDYDTKFNCLVCILK